MKHLFIFFSIIFCTWNLQAQVQIVSGILTDCYSKTRIENAQIILEWETPNGQRKKLETETNSLGFYEFKDTAFQIGSFCLVKFKKRNHTQGANAFDIENEATVVNGCINNLKSTTCCFPPLPQKK